ncbi:triple gene block protein 3 [Yam latent virus]|uniref:Movement protein TGBp3 n=1 Tax=Yam latent virus TaxID=1592930 RepID=A0A0B4VMH7_9VIRU|nr:triple gene block protein 3 [Yam latent virus]AJD23368.1 triple gene block protein 3 [Yam latent virus]
MLQYILVCVLSFMVLLFCLHFSSRECLVLITGESVRLQGCVITEEFAQAMSKVKALGY